MFLSWQLAFELTTPSQFSIYVAIISAKGGLPRASYTPVPYFLYLKFSWFFANSASRDLETIWWNPSILWMW